MLDYKYPGMLNCVLPVSLFAFFKNKIEFPLERLYFFEFCFFCSNTSPFFYPPLFFSLFLSWGGYYNNKVWHLIKSTFTYRKDTCSCIFTFRKIKIVLSDKNKLYSTYSLQRADKKITISVKKKFIKN